MHPRHPIGLTYTGTNAGDGFGFRALALLNTSSNVPEPAAFGILGGAVAALAAVRGRGRKKVRAVA